MPSPADLITALRPQLLDLIRRALPADWPPEAAVGVLVQCSLRALAQDCHHQIDLFEKALQFYGQDVANSFPDLASLSQAEQAVLSGKELPRC